MRRLLVFTALLAALASCTARTGNVKLRGLEPLNLNDRGESGVVTVRIYQLKDEARFQSSVFDTLWTNDSEALGEDRLADPTTVKVYPPSGSEATVQKADIGQLTTGTRYIGVMGLYSKTDPEGRRRVVIPVDELSKRIVEFEGYSVRLTDN